MRSNRKRKAGFYWIRFEGNDVVAEYRPPETVLSENWPGRWWIPCRASHVIDSEVCELLSDRLPEPAGIPDTVNPKRQGIANRKKRCKKR
jgi:hypothetical protein